MTIKDDPLIQQADAVAAEAARLRQALERSQAMVRQKARRLAQLGAELDVLLPHPPEELARVRALLAQNPPEEEGS